MRGYCHKEGLLIVSIPSSIEIFLFDFGIQDGCDTPTTTQQYHPEPRALFTEDEIANAANANQFVEEMAAKTQLDPREITVDEITHWKG